MAKFIKPKRLSGAMILAGLAGTLSGCMDSGTTSGMENSAKAVTVTLKSKANAFTSFAAGKYGTGPATLGNALTLSFSAPKGARLSFASMFGQSNDWFFAPDTEGIDLRGAQGRPVTGDITSQIRLWDAGTEMDETPFAGPNQGPRQAGPNTGAADPDDKVRMVADTAFSTERFFTADLEALDGRAFRITDTFFGPDGNGIALFQGGSARSGDVTGEVALWDAGTEVNETPGSGTEPGAKTGCAELGKDRGRHGENVRWDGLISGRRGDTGRYPEPQVQTVAVRESDYPRHPYWGFI
ncbi:MAG: spondin domain-containing protein [Fibrobacteria bacterium]